MSRKSAPRSRSRVPGATEVTVSTLQGYLGAPAPGLRKRSGNVRERPPGGPAAPLQLWPHEFARVERHRGEVAGVELGQAVAQRHLVAQPQHQVPAGGRLDAERRRTEADAAPR